MRSVRTRRRREELLASYAGFVDDGTYSMVTTERVVFDYVDARWASTRSRRC